MKNKRITHMKEYIRHECGICGSNEFKTTYADGKWTIECRCGAINKPSSNFNPCGDCVHLKCYEDDGKCIEDI